MSRRDVKQTGSNTVPLGEAMGRLRLGGGGGGPSLLNPSYLGGGGSSSVVETYETRGVHMSTKFRVIYPIIERIFSTSSIVSLHDG